MQLIKQKSETSLPTIFYFISLFVIIIQCGTTLMVAQDNLVEKILFASSGRDTIWFLNPSIYIMNPDGSDLAIISDTLIGSRPRISPDHGKIAYQGTYSDEYLLPQQIHVMNVDGSMDRIVTLYDHNGQIEPHMNDSFSPFWSPDGQWIAFDRCIDCEMGGVNNEIFRIALDTSDSINEVRLTNNPNSDLLYDWSHVLDRILFRSHYFAEDHDSDGELFTMDPWGEDWVQLTNNDYWEGTARYSPDGQHIAFTSNRDNTKGEIYLMQPDGSDVVRMTDNNIRESELCWSPDGLNIAFRGDTAWNDYNVHLFILDINTLDTNQITFGPFYDDMPEWGILDFSSVDIKQEGLRHNTPISTISNFPNPFNKVTNFSYEVITPVNVSLVVYNTLGQTVKTIMNSKHYPGHYTVRWDGTDDSKIKVPSGIYLYQLMFDDMVTGSAKTVYLK